MQTVPIRYEERLKLPSLGLPPDVYKQQQLTIESEKYICIKEVGPDGSTFFDIVDLAQSKVQKKPINADSAMMHPTKTLFCVRVKQNIQVILREIHKNRLLMLAKKLY